MKITTTFLKKVIREEIKKINEEAPGPSAPPTGAPAETKPEEEDPEALATLQTLRKELVASARSLTGINTQELPFIKVALSIIQKAKEGNINMGALRTHLALVQKDLTQVK